MFIYIRIMITKNIIIIEEPFLPGSISTAKSRCGKLECACRAKPPKLHGTYYRWTGMIDGKRTTKTISRDVALECLQRIARYKRFKRQIDSILKRSLLDAPWMADSKK